MKKKDLCYLREAKQDILLKIASKVLEFKTKKKIKNQHLGNIFFTPSLNLISRGDA